MDNQEQEKPGSQTPPAGDAWQEVGRQFQILGDSLAAAFRASWSNPQHRQRLEGMQGDLEKMVKDLDNAIQDASVSPQAQQARAEARKAAESLRQASEQTVQEVRPHLLSALKQVNEEIRRMVERMEGSGSQPESEEKKQ